MFRRQLPLVSWWLQAPPAAVAMVGVMSLLVFAGVYAIGNPVDILISPQASQAEIARAKMQLVSSALFARDSQQSMADIFGRAAMLGLTPQDVLNWTREIEAVTPEDVRRAAEKLLPIEHSLTGHLSGTGER
mgnify:CR=1 FL=1